MKLAWLIGKGFLALFVSFIAASIPNKFLVWNQYWNKTIFQVQTVDFNILFHTLPTKLSYNLINKDFQEIQNTLNSNYALFGLVVTDCQTSDNLCPEQKILFASNKYKDWKNLISVPELAKYNYDLLYDPPPKYAEGKIEGHWLTERKPTNNINQGKIIARVYYIRGKAPSFKQDYLETFLPNYFTSTLDVHEKYRLMINMVMIYGILGWSILELIISINKQKSEKRALKIQNELLDAQQKTLDIENNLLTEQQRALEAENQLLKMINFHDIFNQIIEQDISAAIANRLQQLDSILKSILLRVESDANNIIHDIYQAPLLTNINRRNIIQDLKANQPMIKISTELIELLEEADESVQALEWIVEDLRGIARIESEATFVQEQIQHFSEHLPPSVKEWTLNFEYIEQPLWINCNPWHLKNILKNALYNSSRALKQYRRQLKTNFHGKIWVRCRREENLAVIEIEDNGPGIPAEMLNKLYESPERLNTREGNLRGNGSMIVYAYLTLHGGRVLKINTETGARVSFLFPLIP